MVFGRRKRSASAHYQPLSSPAAQSAQSAASHAFLKSQTSNASLSSAAAAAALRNLTPTPTSVEDVQTKRMVQRRASVQSQAPLGGRRSVSASGTLRRSSSNSSMSARTFRDQSPSRPLTSSGPISPPTDVPPLPSIPSQYGRKPQNRRAVSMEPSMRAPPASPPRSVARGVDREQGRGSPIHQRVTSLGMLPELERPELERSGSRNSVNFSYPLGSRPTSPAAESPPKTLHEAIQEPIPEEPVREKPLQERSPNRPRAQASGSVEGSPAATRSGRLAGSAAAAALGVTPQKSSPKVTARPEQARDAPVPADPLEQYTGNAKPVAATTKHDYTSSRTLHEGWPSTVREQEEPEDFDRDVDDIQIRQGRNRMTSASPTADHVEAVPAPVAPSSPSELRPEQQQNLRQSSSPGRSARFSQLLQVSGAGDQIHQPPPRSVSPVKSALKHPRRSSSSPDRRLSVTGRVQPSSELSDGTSVASDEGARIGAKKKAHKVSFDDEAEVVGLAASPPTSPEEYTPESPPSNKAKSRMSWLGVGKKKPPMELASDDDWNVVMKPRQELPSFGSIRGSRDGGMKRLPIPDFSDNESSSSSDSDAPSKQKKSSPIEHTFGGILSKPQPTPAEYFPPHDVSTLEQLSVNGAAKPTQPTATPENKFTDEPANRQPDAGVNSDLSVPAIAIEPATPPAEEHKQSFDSKRSSMDQYRIPGGFPPSGSDRSLKSTAKKTQSQVVASAVPTLDDVDTEDEYSDSIYSDAPEDIDIDGDGFGSINAIVDKGSAPRSAPPLETVSESRDATPKPVDRTTISDAPSQNVNVQVPEEVRSVTPTQNSVNRLVEESPASSVGYACEPERSPVSAMPIPRSSPGPDGSPQAQSNTRARPMSMAVDTNGASRMRDPRYSSNDTSPQGGNAKQRPLSVGPAFHKAAGPPIFPSSLRRKTSNGSDSSSSFKRASRRGDAVSMRRTMRAGAGANGQAQPPTERHESPLEHRPMSSGSSNGTMRKTLRGPARGERYSYFSTNNKAPPRAKFTKPPPKSARTTRFANSDDENEDEPRPQFFTSRFADSSDEDQPRNTALRPVRGIPRRKGADDGDSTELEDSSEESARQQAQSGIALGAVPPSPGTSGNNAPPRSMSGMAAVARQRGMSQRDLEEFIMAPPRGRKPGLLTRLGIKKPKNSENRIRKSDIESPSRRDTPLERSRMELDQLRGDGIVTGNYTTVSAGSPEPTPSKLVKRNSKRQSTAPDAWPLPPDAKEPALQPVAEQPQDVPPPPQTIDNVDAARNGSIVANGDPAGASPIAKEPEAHGDPNNDSASEITSPEVQGHSARDVVIAGSGRKKRFPLLRKAFGLRA